MLSIRSGITFVTGVFTVVGAALGIVGYVAMSWAQVQFVTAAAGSTAGRFGPVVLASIFFGASVSLLFAGPILAGTVGAMVGSQFRRPRDAAVVGGAGTFLGCLALALLGTGSPSLLSGPGTSQLFGIGALAGPLLAGVVMSTVVGAAVAAFASRGAR